MGAKLGSGGGPMADINVTPLIDVVLVLLVVFMVITPMLSAGKEVLLPEAEHATTVKEVGEHIVISVTMEEGWWVEAEQVDADTLIDQLNVEYGKDSTRSILIKGDHRLPYHEVRAVMDLLAETGFTAVLIAADKEK